VVGDGEERRDHQDEQRQARDPDGERKPRSASPATGDGCVCDDVVVPAGFTGAHRGSFNRPPAMGRQQIPVSIGKM
jgi:hypothetical protein